MPSNSDQNLLFGIIALQMDFVQREEMVAATSAWLTDKTRKIEEILVEQGALSERDRHLLAPLVARHLENHGDDPQRSVAALSTIGSVADELRGLGDESIEATLSIVASDRPDEVHEQTVAHESRAPTAKGGAPSEAADARFRILRSHAKGGLGEVYVAEDTELNREVALKEIQSKYADDESNRLRFLLEAEVTGGLEHPGIVPVYGLGRYDDGRPFYAMRFIKGDSLQEAADRFHGGAASESDLDFNGVEFRKLLGRFVDVCQAIEYAHSRGVLHRDLKPGNIMLGKYGETLVVDWGLAKAQVRDDVNPVDGETTLRPASASGSAPTVMGSAIGTPAFMPPEQAAGDLDKLGPQSDVYSLGATLYYLLTGQSPFSSKDIQRLLQQVQEGNFTGPREVKTAIPKSLEAICLRAMSNRPESRYASPQDLAEDVERYLADEPVSAYAEPLMNRAIRWVRKHQTFSVTTAAVVLLSAIGCGVFSTIVSTKNAELSAANAREIEARTLAEANEQSAREQGQLALTTLASVINDIQKGLALSAGSSEIRRNLLRTSISKLESVSSRHVDKSQVDAQTFRALSELGDVVLRFGSTAADAAPLRAARLPVAEEQQSAVRLAETFYQRAHEIAKQLAAEDPASARAQADLSDSHENLGWIQLDLGHSGKALDHFQKQLEIMHKLSENNADRAQTQSNLSAAFYNMGYVQLELGRLSDAMNSYEKSLQINEKLTLQQPKNSNFQSALAGSHRGMGDVLLASDHARDALTHYKRALAIYEQVAFDSPDNTNARELLIYSRFHLANLQLNVGQADVALTGYQKALEAAQELANHDSNSIIAQQYLSLSYLGIGDAQRVLDQTKNALESFQKGLAFIEERAANNPDDQIALQNLYAGYAKLGQAQLVLKQIEMALVSLQRALDTAKKLAQIDPNSAGRQGDLVSSYTLLGHAQRKANRMDEALASYQSALGIIRKENKDDIGHYQTMVALYGEVGTCQLILGQDRDAHASIGKALEIARNWAKSEPSNAAARNALSLAHGKMGLAEQRSTDFDAASTHLRTAIDLLDRLKADNLTVGGAAASRQYWSKMLTKSENARIAVGDWAVLLEQPQDSLPNLLVIRAVTFTKRGRFANAAAAAAKLRTLTSATGAQLYNGSCVFSICAASIKPADGKSLTNEQAAQREAWINEALTTLKQAIDAGWNDFEHMRNDEDLKIIRRRVEFRSLLPQTN